MASWTDKRKAQIPFATIIILRRRKRRRKERTIWARSWILRRIQQGAYQNLVQELAEEDKEMLRRYFRIDDVTFKEILNQLICRLATGIIERLKTRLFSHWTFICARSSHRSCRR
eukprot:gene3825-4357_t